MAVRRYEHSAYSRNILDSGQALLVIVAGVLLIVAVTDTAVANVTDVSAAIAFGALIAFGELLRLTLPGDREAAPIAAAGSLAYALLIRVQDVPARNSMQQVVAVAAIGMLIGALPHLAVGRPARLTAMAARLVAVACVAAVFRPLAGHQVISGHWWSGRGSAWRWLTSCACSSRWASPWAPPPC